MTTVLDLSAASALDGTERIYCAQSSTDKYTTPDQIGDRVIARDETAEVIRDVIAAALQNGANITITHDDSPNTITIGFSGVLPVANGGSWPLHAGYKSTRWYRTFFSGTATVTAVADRMYAHPVFIHQAVTISGLGIRIGTGVASTNVILGIYSNSNGAPGTLLHQCQAAIATATSTSNATGTFASNPTLQPGVYWFAAIFSGAPSYIGALSTDGFGVTQVGITNGSSLSTSASGVQITSQSYAGGFPSSFGSETVTTGSVPLILFQAA